MTDTTTSAPGTLRGLLERNGWEVVRATQFLRYGLANHLGWLVHGTGGGQRLWPHLDHPALYAEYESSLVLKGAGDSILFVCRPCRDA